MPGRRAGHDSGRFGDSCARFTRFFGDKVLPCPPIRAVAAVPQRPDEVGRHCLAETDALPFNVHVQRARLGFLRLTAAESVAIGDPYRQIFVDPQAILAVQLALCPEDCDGPAALVDGRFCRKRAVGLVVGGTWHTKVKPYRPSEGLLYQALVQRYHGLADWDDTLFIEDVKKTVAAGEPAWNKCTTLQAVEERCGDVDRLISSIKSQGFLVTPKPIRVNIGPEGEFIKSSNGRHRIALGLITGQPIPVQVLVRHQNWEIIRRRHAAGEQKHPDHPDLL